MSRQILAIDVRNKAIAFVLLNAGLKTSVVQQSGYIPYAEDQSDQDPVSLALKTVAQQISVNGSSIVLSMPGDRALYRNLSMPFHEEKKIRQTLTFELEPQLPIGVDKLSIDFHKGPKGHESELLTVAVTHDELNTYKAVCTENGFRPQLIAPGSFPLALTLLTCANQIPEQALILDADHFKSILYAVAGRHIFAVRVLPSGFTDESALELFALRVRQTLTSFTDMLETAFTPKQLFISGPAVQENENIQKLALALEIKVDIIDLRAYLPKIDLSTNVETWNPVLMDNALSLALIEAEGQSCPSFLRISSPMRNYWNSYKAYIKLPAIVFGIVLLIGLTGVFSEIRLLQNRLDDIHARMDDVFKTTFPASKMVGQDREEQMKSEILKLKSQNVNPEQGAATVRSIDILYEISRLIPKENDVVFQRLVIGGDSVTISGETSAFTVVDDIKAKLQTAAIFKQITISSANMDKSGKTVLFKLKIDL